MHGILAVSIGLNNIEAAPAFFFLTLGKVFKGNWWLIVFVLCSPYLSHFPSLVNQNQKRWHNNGASSHWAEPSLYSQPCVQLGRGVTDGCSIDRSADREGN